MSRDSFNVRAWRRYGGFLSGPADSGTVFPPCSSFFFFSPHGQQKSPGRLFLFPAARLLVWTSNVFEPRSVADEFRFSLLLFIPSIGFSGLAHGLRRPNRPRNELGARVRATQKPRGHARFICLLFVKIRLAEEKRRGRAAANDTAIDTPRQTRCYRVEKRIGTAKKLVFSFYFFFHPTLFVRRLNRGLCDVHSSRPSARGNRVFAADYFISDTDRVVRISPLPEQIELFIRHTAGTFGLARRYFVKFAINVQRVGHEYSRRPALVDVKSSNWQRVFHNTLGPCGVKSVY